MDSIATRMYDTHEIMVEKGFWEEALAEEIPPDTEHMLMAAAIAAFTGALLKEQRKTGKVTPERIHALVDICIQIQRRLANDLPFLIGVPSPLAAHYVRQHLHLINEGAEALDAFIEGGCETSDAEWREEIADVGIIWLDLCGSVNAAAMVAAIDDKMTINQQRVRKYGTAEAERIEEAADVPLAE